MHIIYFKIILPALALLASLSTPANLWKDYKSDTVRRVIKQNSTFLRFHNYEYLLKATKFWFFVKSSYFFKKIRPEIELYRAFDQFLLTIESEEIRWRWVSTYSIQSWTTLATKVADQEQWNDWWELKLFYYWGNTRLYEPWENSLSERVQN